MNANSELQSSAEPPPAAEVIDEQIEPRPLPGCDGKGSRSNTRVGKIARLPRQIREDLNHRLADGEVGRQLVEWLNTLPEVQAVLAAKFSGRPINEQKLTEWKQGGFEEWLRQQEASAWMQTLAEEDDELKAQCGAVPLTERLTNTMLVALGRLLREISASPAGPEQVKTLLNVADRLAKVRRGEVAAERARLERERWEAKEELAREKKQIEDEAWANFHRNTAHLFPKGNEDYLSPSNIAIPPEIQAIFDASNRRIARNQANAQAAQAAQGKSNQIKPDQGGKTAVPAAPPGSAGASPSRAQSSRADQAPKEQGAGAPPPQDDSRGGGAPAPCGSLRNDPNFHAHLPGWAR